MPDNGFVNNMWNRLRHYQAMGVGTRNKEQQGYDDPRCADNADNVFAQPVHCDMDTCKRG